MLIYHHTICRLCILMMVALFGALIPQLSWAPPTLIRNTSKVCLSQDGYKLYVSQVYFVQTIHTWAKCLYQPADNISFLNKYVTSGFTAKSVHMVEVALSNPSPSISGPCWWDMVHLFISILPQTCPPAHCTARTGSFLNSCFCIRVLMWACQRRLQPLFSVSHS